MLRRFDNRGEVEKAKIELLRKELISTLEDSLARR